MGINRTPEQQAKMETQQKVAEIVEQQNAASKPSDDFFDYETEQKKIADQLANLDNTIADEIITTDKPQDQVGHTLHTQEFYEQQQPFAAASETKGPPVRKTPLKKPSNFNIRDLDESMLFDPRYADIIPNIQAASYELNDMLNLRPINPNIRFRWANFKNHVQGNLARYLALGFTTASPKDVDQTKQPLHESMIEGDQVKYYDIVLLKVDVMRLMALYKAGILRAVNKLANHQKQGISDARQQFNSDLAGVEGGTRNYNRIKEATGKEPVEFFVPGQEESVVRQ